MAMYTVMKNIRPHDDGYLWVRNQLSMAAPNHTLINPDGHPVVHAYRTNDRRWRVVQDGTGEILADNLATAGEALATADNLCRPCAYVDRHQSHGIIACDLDRAPGSIYCQPHTERVG